MIFTLNGTRWPQTPMLTLKKMETIMEPEEVIKLRAMFTSMIE